MSNWPKGLFKKPGSEIWHMRWSVDGKQQRQSTGTSSLKDAEQKYHQACAAKIIPDKRNIGYLLDNLIEDYEENSQCVDWCKQNVKNHLRGPFGTMRCQDLKKGDVVDFRRDMRKDGFAPATINRCVALLKRSFNLVDLRFPKIDMLDESKQVRKGFVEDEQFWRIYEELIDHAKPLALYLYESGCRYSEARDLVWDQVDRREGLVRLQPGETKNDEPRVIPLSEQMLFWIDRLDQQGWGKNCNGVNPKSETAS